MQQNSTAGVSFTDSLMRALLQIGHDGSRRIVLLLQCGDQRGLARGHLAF